MTSDGELPCLCPICRTGLSQFDSIGAPGSPGHRAGARCSHCGSLERNRLAWLYLLNATDLFSDYERTAVLFECAEPLLSTKLAQAGEPATLCAGAAPAPGGRLAYPDHTFDAAYLGHVLGTLPDDRWFLRELRRVLKPTGWAIVHTFVVRDRTEELDAGEARRRGRFRIYGRDLPERLAPVGFTVQADAYAQRLGPERARRYGLAPDEVLYRLTPSRRQANPNV
jgi:SAM-dependent methyltransferase